MNKIGMYTDDEILEFMTDGEGRGFLGRSMYDAIRETIEEKDKEIEKINKENKILKEALYTIWNEEIDIDYDKLQKAINDIKNMQKEADKELNNGLHKMIFGSDDNE